MAVIQHAIRAQQRGWHIFTLPPGKKHDPRLKWSQAATNDLNKIIARWSWHPEANIGIACKPSELLVVDCDAPKTDGADSGIDVLRELCESNKADWSELMGTYRVSTTRKGMHLYFTWPPHLKASQASIVRGVLDVRTNGGTSGGYVVGAGSSTPHGMYTVEDDGPVAPCPRWLVELVREKPAPPRPEAPAYAKSRNYGGLAATVANAHEGNRNSALLWSARSMCSDGAPIGEAEQVLTQPAQIAGLKVAEIRQTIRSAYRLQGLKEGN